MVLCVFTWCVCKHRHICVVPLGQNTWTYGTGVFGNYTVQSRVHWHTHMKFFQATICAAFAVSRYQPFWWWRFQFQIRRETGWVTGLIPHTEREQRVIICWDICVLVTLTVLVWGLCCWDNEVLSPFYPLISLTEPSATFRPFTFPIETVQRPCCCPQGPPTEREHVGQI